MNLNLTLVIPVPIPILEDLVKLLLELQSRLPFPDRVPAQRIDPIPQAVTSQPDRPLHSISSQRSGEQRLLGLGLLFEDLQPLEVPKAWLFVKVAREAKYFKLALPFSSRWPGLGPVV